MARGLFIQAFLCAVLVGGTAPFAFSEEPWETVAVAGIAAINRGDGDAFVKCAHPDFKAWLRTSFMKGLRSQPESKATAEVLKAFP